MSSSPPLPIMAKGVITLQQINQNAFTGFGFPISQLRTHADTDAGIVAGVRCSREYRYTGIGRLDPTGAGVGQGSGPEQRNTEEETETDSDLVNPADTDTDEADKNAATYYGVTMEDR